LYTLDKMEISLKSFNAYEVYNKTMEFAYFQDGREFKKKLQEQEVKLFRAVFLDVSWLFILFFFSFLGLGIWRINRLAFKMTNQIIFLYETLYPISRDRKTKKKEVVQLSFKHSSKELN
jgi:hypothetical protein